MSLSRDQILTAADRPVKRVPVPEWGGDVVVATMDGELRWRYEQLLHGKDKFPRSMLRAVIVTICAVDDGGQPLFTEDDVPALHAKSGTALDRVFEEAATLNKLFKVDVEGAEKNSETAPNSSSPTD